MLRGESSNLGKTFLLGPVNKVCPRTAARADDLSGACQLHGNVQCVSASQFYINGQCGIWQT